MVLGGQGNSRPPQPIMLGSEEVMSAGAVRGVLSDDYRKPVVVLRHCFQIPRIGDLGTKCKVETSSCGTSPCEVNSISKNGKLRGGVGDMASPPNRRENNLADALFARATSKPSGHLQLKE